MTAKWLTSQVLSEFFRRANFQKKTFQLITTHKKMLRSTNFRPNFGP